MTLAVRAAAPDFEAALRVLRGGGLVAYPTETVWGLAAAARLEAGVAALRDWKGRDASAPVSVLVPEAAALSGLGFDVSQAARRLVDACWPGPLTLVLPCATSFGRGVARADGAVGVRCSSHPLAAALAREALRAGVGPVTATSFNRSGVAPARSLAEACASADDAILVLDPHGLDAGDGAPSTVVDVTGASPRILREGAIPRQTIEALLRGAS